MKLEEIFKERVYRHIVRNRDFYSEAGLNKDMVGILFDEVKRIFPNYPVKRKTIEQQLRFLLTKAKSLNYSFNIRFPDHADGESDDDDELLLEKRGFVPKGKRVKKAIKKNEYGIREIETIGLVKVYRFILQNKNSFIRKTIVEVNLLIEEFDFHHDLKQQLLNCIRTVHTSWKSKKGMPARMIYEDYIDTSAPDEFLREMIKSQNSTTALTTSANDDEVSSSSESTVQDVANNELSQAHQNTEQTQRDPVSDSDDLVQITSTADGHDDIEMEPNVLSNTLQPATGVTEYDESLNGSSAPRPDRKRKRTEHTDSGKFI